MVYTFVAHKKDAPVIKGKIEAVGETQAEELLYEQGYYRILSIKEIKPLPSIEELLPTVYAVKRQEIADFFRQLATLLESGITIYTALNLLRTQTGGRVFKKIIAEVVADIGEGKSFSDAMSKYPRVFPNTYCQVIGASEQTGNMESSLRQIATHIENNAKTRQNIARALAYPSLVIILAIGVTVLLLTVVLPPMTDLFRAMGQELPWTTNLMIAISGFLTENGLALLAAIAAIIILLGVYIRLPSGRLKYDRFLLNMPGIGGIVIQRSMAQFCRTMHLLMEAGVLLPQILETLIRTTANSVIREALVDIREKLIQGQGLSQPMSANGVFPRILTEMVIIGEISGTLSANIAVVGEYMEERANQRIKFMTSMIEPSLTIVVGLVVVFIAMATVMPLYSIMNSMS